MALEGKQLPDLIEGDIQQLVDDAYAENKKIDYKRTLPGTADKDRKEFLADVSSFANTVGGHLVFGVREEGGLPKEIVGLGAIDREAQELRLQTMLQDGLSPRIPGIQLRSVAVTSGQTVLVLRVPQSWLGPHQVIFQKDHRFYGRNANGKYLLDATELRSSILLGQNERERVERFRTERLQRILSGEGPIPLEGTPKVVVHVVPLGSRSTVDVAALNKNFMKLYPLISPSPSSNVSINFDGLTLYGPANPPATRFVQVFRDGSLEWVDTTALRALDGTPSHEVPYGFDSQFLKWVRSCTRFVWEEWADVPTAVLISLIGVRDYRMELSPRGFPPMSRNRIDRENLILPEVVIEARPTSFAAVFKPSLDLIWNAAGFPASPWFGPSGEWRGEVDAN